MGNYTNHRVPSRKVVADENTKINKLRDLRLAAEAAQREAGTWGDMSVGEIIHEPTGAVFVFSWKGASSPDLDRMYRARLPELSLDEHERLQDWVDRCHRPHFRQSLVGWRLSRVEAKRAKQARIDQHRAGGARVVNDAPTAAATE